MTGVADDLVKDSPDGKLGEDGTSGRLSPGAAEPPKLRDQEPKDHEPQDNLQRSAQHQLDQHQAGQHQAGQHQAADIDPDKLLKKRASALLASEAKAVQFDLIAAKFSGFIVGLLVIAQALVIAGILANALTDLDGFTDRSSDLTFLLGFFILILVLRGLFSFAQETFGIRAATKVKTSLRMRLIDKLLGQGPAARDRSTGSTVTVVVDQVEALEGYYAHFLVLKPLAVAIPLVILAVAFAINWVVAVIFLALAPLVPITMALIGKRAAAANRRQFQVLSRMGGMFLDRLQGLTTLVLFGAGEREARRIEDVAQDFRRSTMAVLRVAFLSSTALEVFSAAAIALVATYVGLSLMGAISIAPDSAPVTLFSGILLLLLAPEFFNPLRQMATHYHDRMAATAAAETFVGILDDENVPQSSGMSARTNVALPRLSLTDAPPIRFNDVTLRYPGDRAPALLSTSFDAPAGQITAFVGQSGAGKSSVLNLVLGFVSPTSGEVLVDGKPLATLDGQSIRDQIAWVGQSPQLFLGTIAENIALGREHVGLPSIEAAAGNAGVLDFAAELPNGLDTVIGERGFGLSGGQAQRVALARAFLKQAPILILDEPTASLDLETERVLLEPLLRLAHGRTTLLATHSPALAARANRIVTLSEGRVLSVGDGESG